ncbi:MAG: hypothetical protein ACK48K_12050 [Planctomycetota bacterium]|jgi:hypothetical protein
MEKLLASSSSANPTDLVKMSEQEILKIESIDTRDWDASAPSMAFNQPGESPGLGNVTAQYPTVVTA